MGSYPWCFRRCQANQPAKLTSPANNKPNVAGSGTSETANTPKLCQPEVEIHLLAGSSTDGTFSQPVPVQWKSRNRVGSSVNRSSYRKIKSTRLN